MIIGEVKELISVAEGNDKSAAVYCEDEVCSLGVCGGGPEARRSMPGQTEARRKLRRIEPLLIVNRSDELRGESPIELGNTGSYETTRR